MKIAIIDYTAGNICSVQNALIRLGYNSYLADSEDLLRQADKIIFPGVGNAGSAMRNLRDKGLDKIIPSLQQPVLGICLGMQLLCNWSEEDNTECLGIIKASVKRFENQGGSNFKVPHVGWNNIELLNPGHRGEESRDEYVYFVHSYYAEICESTTAITNYILPFSAMLQQDNFFGMQFHAEKSGPFGEYLLNQFLQNDLV